MDGNNPQTPVEFITLTVLNILSWATAAIGFLGQVLSVILTCLTIYYMVRKIKSLNKKEKGENND